MGIKKFFTVRVVKHWQRLHREAVGALSMVRLERDLNNLMALLI